MLPRMIINTLCLLELLCPQGTLALKNLKAYNNILFQKLNLSLLKFSYLPIHRLYRYLQIFAASNKSIHNTSSISQGSIIP